MNQNIKNKLSDLLNNPTIDEQTLLVNLKRILQEDEANTSIVRDSKTLMSLVSDNLEQLRHGNNQQHVIKTGLADFDELFGGFGLGEFIVIGGRPGMGKTQLLIQLALEVSTENPVLYFTFDLSLYQLSNKFMSAVSDISVDKLLFGDLTENDRVNLNQEAEKLKTNQLFLNDSCHSSISDLRSLVQQHIAANNVKVIIIDYIQMFSARRTRQNRDLEVAYITRELKNIAKDFNICVIASSQLSRSVEMRGGDKRPQLSDLRESGAIEQDADKVIFIYRPEYYGLLQDESGYSTNGLVDIILEKNRNGKTGTIQLMRKPSFTGFLKFEGHRNHFEFDNNRLNEINETPF